MKSFCLVDTFGTAAFGRSPGFLRAKETMKRKNNKARAWTRHTKPRYVLPTNRHGTSKSACPYLNVFSLLFKFVLKIKRTHDCQPDTDTLTPKQGFITPVTFNSPEVVVFHIHSDLFAHACGLHLATDQPTKQLNRLGMWSKLILSHLTSWFSFFVASLFFSGDGCFLFLGCRSSPFSAPPGSFPWVRFPFEPWPAEYPGKNMGRA